MARLRLVANFSWLLLPSIITSFSPSQIISTSRQSLYQNSLGNFDRTSSALCINRGSSTSPSCLHTKLKSSASASNVDQSQNAGSEKTNQSVTTVTTTQKDNKQLDMPWSDSQEWALKDNLPKFTVMIPTDGSAEQYAMWRSLTREVPELAGYPVPFLVQMHGQIKDINQTTPGVLPVVDDFEFASNGGIIGCAYGLPGIADGTRINTPPLIGVENTVPLGYVTTEDDQDKNIGFSYELGACASSSVYSLDGFQRSAALLSARQMMMEGMDVSTSSSRQVTSVAKGAMLEGTELLADAEANQDLLYLGGATALLIASATAIGALSHHLTVNVFWV